MKVEQISIFLENKSGRLAEVTRLLGEGGINVASQGWLQRLAEGFRHRLHARPEGEQLRSVRSAPAQDLAREYPEGQAAVATLQRDQARKHRARLDPRSGSDASGPDT